MRGKQDKLKSPDRHVTGGRSVYPDTNLRCPPLPRAKLDMMDTQSPTESDGIDCTKSRMGGKLSYIVQTHYSTSSFIKKEASKCTPDQSSSALFDSDNNHFPLADSSLLSRSVPSHIQPVSWTSQKSLNNSRKRRNQATMNLSPLGLRGPSSLRS